MTEVDSTDHTDVAHRADQNAVPTAVRLRIVLAPGDDFEAQRLAVRAAGAGYDGRTKSWALWLDTNSLNPDAHEFAGLFAAADRYGTHLAINAVQP